MHDVAREPRRDRLAHAIVVRLDQVVAARPVGAHQAGGAQRGERRPPRGAVERDRLADHRLRQRAGDHDQREHARVVGRQIADAAGDRVVEPGRGGAAIAGAARRCQ